MRGKCPPKNEKKANFVYILHLLFLLLPKKATAAAQSAADKLLHMTLSMQQGGGGRQKSGLDQRRPKRLAAIWLCDTLLQMYDGYTA